MAGLRVVTTTEAEIALVASTPKTVLQLVAPANQRLLLKGFAISFDGISPTSEPVTVELVKQSTAGTSSAATPVRDGDPGSETIQTTARKDCSVEPTSSDVLRRYEVHPQGGGIERVFGLDDQIPIPGGTRLGLRATVPSGGTGVNCTGHMINEE